MKKWFIVLILMLFTIAVMAQVADSTHVFDPSKIPAPGSGWQDWIGWAIGIVLVLWEVILRFIPTAKDWTLVTKIVSILDWIVGLFNGGVGNAAKTQSGVKKSFKQTVV